MNRKLFLLFAFFMSFSEARSQEIDEIACSFLTSIANGDTASWKNFFPQPGDTKVLMRETMKMQGIEVEDGEDYPSPENDSAFLNFEILMIKQIKFLKDSLSKTGVNWSMATCDSMTFELKRSPVSPFAVASGKLYFNPGVKGGTLIIKTAVRIGRSWRVFAIGFE